MKILVIRAGAVGDVILTTGIVRQLSITHQTNVDVATDCSFVFTNNNYTGTVAQIANFNKADYDLVVDLDMSYELQPKLHPIDAYAQVAKISHDVNLKPELHITSVSGLPNRFIALHMRKHFWPNRNLPEDFWINLIGEIISSTDIPVVQIGSSHDLQFGEISGKLINLVGKLDVHQTTGVIDSAVAFVGVDSGVLHMAATTETPIVGLYTSVRAEYREPKYRTSPHKNIIANIDCYGCVESMPAPVTSYYCNRGDEQCTRSFDSANVFRELKTLL
jgi:ADP-heptose:LPS heptosyltransferase